MSLDSLRAWIIAYPFTENKKKKRGRQYEKESWRLKLKTKKLAELENTKPLVYMMQWSENLEDIYEQKTLLTNCGGEN